MDNIVQAVSGVMAKTGFADGPPLRSGITIADHTTATFAALGIVAALRQRDLTGAASWSTSRCSTCSPRWCSTSRSTTTPPSASPCAPATPTARGAPINTYRCADGWVSVTCTSDGQSQRLCALMDRPELLEQFPDVRARARRGARSTPRSKRGPSTRPAREVEAALVGIGFPAGRVRDPIEAARDPAVRGRAGCSSELRHPDAPADRPSGFLGARLPIAFAGRVDLPPAEPLGASTDAVLRELAGCDDDELARLRADGVIA